MEKDRGVEREFWLSFKDKTWLPSAKAILVLIASLVVCVRRCSLFRHLRRAVCIAFLGMTIVRLTPMTILTKRSTRKYHVSAADRLSTKEAKNVSLEISLHESGTAPRSACRTQTPFNIDQRFKLRTVGLFSGLGVM